MSYTSTRTNIMCYKSPTVFHTAIYVLEDQKSITAMKLKSWSRTAKLGPLYEIERPLFPEKIVASANKIA